MLYYKYLVEVLFLSYKLHPIFPGVFYRPKLARKLWEKLEKNKK